MKKMYLALFLTILWTSTIFAAETINGITYILDASARTATVTTGTYSGAIVIPEKVSHNNRDYIVTRIDVNAFKSKSITSVVIPSTVTYIGYQAFYQCTFLNSVTLNEGLQTIGEAAFQYCSALLSVSVPSSVTRIEKFAFADCTALANVTLSEGLTYIGDVAFGYCPKITSITIPSTITSMGVVVFFNSRYIKSIVWNAKNCRDFNNANESPFSKYSPNYNSSAFYASTYTGYSNEDDYVIYVNDWTTSITFGDEVEHIPAYLCYQFQGELRNLVIPDNVKTIGDYAFYNNTKLVSLKLGVGLTEIGKQAFYGCSSLTEVSIPDNVTTINPSAFFYCTSLATLNLGKGIQTLGTGAFGGGGNLSTINIYAVNPPYIDNTVFTSYSDLMAIDLNVRERALEAYEKANIWKNMHLGLVANDTRVFSLTVSSADNTKGSTTPSGNYDEGDAIVIAAQPKDGYHFTKWNDGETANPRTVEMIGDLTYTAYFAAGAPVAPSGDSYLVNINGENCSLNISSQYPEGSKVSVEAVADECFEFQQWSDGDTSNPRTITVTEDADLTAQFNKLRYTITGNSENPSGQVNVEEVNQ
jgi:hypothetical protein